MQYPISPVLASLHWSPVKFKVFLITDKALNEHAQTYLKDFIVPYNPTGTPHFWYAALLVIPKCIGLEMGN